MESLPPPTAFIFTYVVKHKFFDIYIYMYVYVWLVLFYLVAGVILSCPQQIRRKQWEKFPEMLVAMITAQTITIKGLLYGLFFLGFLNSTKKVQIHLMFIEIIMLSTCTHINSISVQNNTVWGWSYSLESITLSVFLLSLTSTIYLTNHSGSTFEIHLSLITS